MIVNHTKQSGRSAFREMNIEAGSVLSESVTNTKSIFSYNFQKPAVELYVDILARTKKDFLRDSIFKGIIVGLGTFAHFAAKATVFHYACDYVINGSLDTGDLTICVIMVVMMAQGVSDGLRGIGYYRKARLAFDSLFSILDEKCLIDVTEEANENKNKAKNLKGKIEFRNVSFAYPTKPDLFVLKNISFTVEAGQAAALVGYSGCGKSTIIQLLERFYDVDDDKGQILIDDINSQSTSMGYCWSRKISFNN